MILLTSFQVNIAIAFTILALIIAFLLGYDVAETKERRAKYVVEAAYRNYQKKLAGMSAWVRANWPNEYDAWKRGHTEGYQQGLDQAVEMEARAEANE